MTARQLNVNPFQEMHSIYISCENRTVCSKIAADLSREKTFRLIAPSMANTKTLLLPIVDPKMIILCHSNKESLYRALTKIKDMRANNYQGIVAVLTDEPCIEDLLYSLQQGVDEYLYNGPKLKLLTEARRMLAAGRQPDCSTWNPEKVGSIGLFRSIGLSPFQMKVLVEFARDFPRLRALSERTKTSETSLRKTFSLIYDKLRAPFAIETQAQLSQLLTICAAVGPTEPTSPPTTWRKPCTCIGSCKPAASIGSTESLTNATSAPPPSSLATWPSKTGAASSTTLPPHEHHASAPTKLQASSNDYFLR